MTKKEAEELDDLLYTIVNVKHAAAKWFYIKGNYELSYKLKDKDWEYVKGLLFIVMEMQTKNEIVTIIQFGESLDVSAAIDNSILSQFLKTGGFRKIADKASFWKSSWEKFKDTAVKEIITKIVLTALAFILGLWTCKISSRSNNQQSGKKDSLQQIIPKK